MSQISQLGARYGGVTYRRDGMFRHRLRNLGLLFGFALLTAASGCRTGGGGTAVGNLPPDLALGPAAVRDSEALSHFGWGLFLNLQDEDARLGGLSQKPGAPPFDSGHLSLPFDSGAADGLALKPAPEGLPPASVPPSAASAKTPAPPVALPAYVTQYLEALRRAPDNREILLLLVASLQNGVEAKTLGAELLAIATANPHCGFLCLTAAEIQEIQGQRAAATAFLERSIPAGGWSDAQLVRKLCGYYWNAKRYADVEKLLRTACQKAGLKGNFSLRLALCMFYQESALLPANAKSEAARTRLLKQALAAGRAAVAIVQKQAPAPGAGRELTPDQCVVMIRLLHTLEAYKEALALVRAARVIFPDADGEFDVWEVESLLKLKRQDEATVLLAKLEKKFGESFRAAEPPATGGGPAAEGAQPYDLRDPEARQQVRENNINLGRLFIEIDKPKEAAVAYERALRTAPTDFRLRLILGQLYLEMNQPDRTIEIVQGVEQLLQHKYRVLSYAYDRLGKVEEAARYLALAEEAALKADDKEFFNKNFYLYFATVCEEAGWIDRAIEKATKALDLDPKDPVAANFLGYVLADQNRDLDRAAELIRQAVAAEPENDAYLDSMAWVCYRQKHFAEALDWMRKALKFSGEKVDPVLLDHAGDISAGLDLWNEARRYWEQALSAGIKDSEKVREKIRGIPPPKPQPAAPKVL